MLGKAFQNAGVAVHEPKRGEVYLIRDDLIVLPEARIPESKARMVHPQRPVLIVQTDVDNSEPLYPVVLIAPMSHRTDLQSERDCLLRAKQGGLDQDSLVHLGLVQPILKTDLQGSPIGALDSWAMNDVDAILAANLGLIERTTNP